jgi:hypothetical protein
MRQIIKFPLVLGAVALCSGLLLAGTYNLTEQTIRENKIERQTGKYDYYASYNIPWYGGSFTIKDGVYMVTQGNYEDKPQYKFTLLTPNSMDLYCYKDGKTYTLYRQ